MGNFFENLLLLYSISHLGFVEINLKFIAAVSPVRYAQSIRVRPHS